LKNVDSRVSQKVILHHFSLNIMTYFQLVVNPLKSTYKYFILKTPTRCFKGTGQVKHAHYLNQPFKICKDQLLEEISRVRDFQLITVRNNEYLSVHAYLAICGIWNFAFCTKKISVEEFSVSQYRCPYNNNLRLLEKRWFWVRPFNYIWCTYARD